MVTPSLPFGGGAPAIPARVGMKSQAALTWSDTLPAGMLPGQCAMSGTRMPPSLSHPFPPLNGPVLLKCRAE